MWFHYTSDQVYVRRCQEGTWYPWVQIYPGAAGADSGWQNPYFSSGWSSLGAPWGPVQFKKLASGLVVMRGLVGSPGIIAAPVNVIQVPAGYRPGINQLFASRIGGNTIRLDVQTDGWVVLSESNSPDAGGWVSVNGINYMAEQ